MIRTVILAVLALVALASNADARQRHRTVVADPGCNIIFPCEGVTSSPRGEYIARSGFGTAQKVYTQRHSAVRVVRAPRESIAILAPEPRQRGVTAVVSHPAGCPARAFCGCGAAVRVFGSPIRSLWLAANWFKFPRTSPAPGMAAVRRHHVFVLEADLGGGVWQVYDANSGGHATRIHARSIAGYVIVNPRGGAA